MAEYTYNIDGFSLTTTWKRVSTQQGSTTVPMGYDIVSASTTKTFSLDGIVLADGENIKRAVLTATLNRGGTTDYGESVTVNGLSFGTGSRKLDVSEFSPGETWDARFYFCASGEAGGAQYNIPTSYSCTMYYSDITLTITTGTGSAFDGEIGSLPEGTKLLIDEPDGTQGTYSIVHHGYGDTSQCLLWRDSALSTAVAFNQNADTFLADNYGKQDTYLNQTFYSGLPDSTRLYIQPAIYPTLDKRLYGTVVDLERYVCTPSVRELKETTGSEEWHGIPFDYLDTVNCGDVYWTRSVYTGSSGSAYYVNSSGDAYYMSRDYARGVRPCFCVLESQLVTPSDSDEGVYILASAVDAPGNVYLNGAAVDQTGQQRDISVTLSWDETASDMVTGYEIWKSASEEGDYVFVGAVSVQSDGTQPTEFVVRTGSKGFQSAYFKVKAITTPDTDYLDSELSQVTRLLSTKRTNIHYYDGAKWLLAMPNYYDADWKQAEGMRYYDGSTWITPGT